MPSHKLRLQTLEIGQTKVIITAKCEGKKQSSVTLNINVTESTQSNVGALSPNESKEAIEVIYKSSAYLEPYYADNDVILRYSLNCYLFVISIQECKNSIDLSSAGSVGETEFGKIIEQAYIQSQQPNEKRTAEEIVMQEVQINKPLLTFNDIYLGTAYPDYIFSIISKTNKRDEYLDPINPPENGFNYKVKDSILAKNPDEMLVLCKELGDSIIANYNSIKELVEL